MARSALLGHYSISDINRDIFVPPKGGERVKKTFKKEKAITIYRDKKGRFTRKKTGNVAYQYSVTEKSIVWVQGKSQYAVEVNLFDKTFSYDVFASVKGDYRVKCQYFMIDMERNFAKNFLPRMGSDEARYWRVIPFFAHYREKKNGIIYYQFYIDENILAEYITAENINQLRIIYKKYLLE